MRDPEYFYCALCNTIITETHMLSEILVMLKDDAPIPKLCSEKCARNFLWLLRQGRAK